MQQSASQHVCVYLCVLFLFVCTFGLERAIIGFCQSVGFTLAYLVALPGWPILQNVCVCVCVVRALEPMPKIVPSLLSSYLAHALSRSLSAALSLQL